MNIQQLRYVVAIANSGTFREAASKLFVSQPSLSVAIKDLEQELNFQIFTRTTTGAVLTSQGMTFYERALEVVRSFDSFENRYLNASEKGNQYSIASQHYDFLPPLITTFSERYPDYKDFRIFESTTIQILDEVAKGHSEIGIIYLNRQNSKGIQQNMDKLGLEAIDLIPFISVRGILWLKKKVWSWRTWRPCLRCVSLRRRTSTFTILRTLWIRQIRLLCLT